MTAAPRTMKRVIAAAELLLVAPAALFMLALFLRNLLPLHDAANGPQHLVLWYASRPWTLWGLLIALPLTVLVLGFATLLQAWTGDARLRESARQAWTAIREHLAMLFVGLASLTAGGVLAVVALHMLAN